MSPLRLVHRIRRIVCISHYTIRKNSRLNPAVANCINLRCSSVKFAVGSSSSAETASSAETGVVLMVISLMINTYFRNSFWVSSRASIVDDNTLVRLLKMVFAWLNFSDITCDWLSTVLDIVFIEFSHSLNIPLLIVANSPELCASKSQSMQEKHKY